LLLVLLTLFSRVERFTVDLYLLEGTDTWDFWV
jgi:hypothetical protein